MRVPLDFDWPLGSPWPRGTVPTGRGWQVWLTDNGGSPQSPVFDNHPDMAQWAVANPASSLVSHHRERLVS